jgi:hypothetical protein
MKKSSNTREQKPGMTSVESRFQLMHKQNNSFIRRVVDNMCSGAIDFRVLEDR